MEVQDRDFGFAKLRADYIEMSKLDVQIGVADEMVAIRAATHEFGTKEWHATGTGVPERSWLRSSIQENERAIAQEFARQLGFVIDGKKTPVDAMRAVGEFCVLKVKDKIKSADTWARPLDPDYAATKKGPGILRETLEMMDSVIYRVIKGDTVVAEGS